MTKNSTPAETAGQAIELPAPEAGFSWCSAEGVEGLARLATTSLPYMPAWTVVVPDPVSTPDIVTTPDTGATTTQE